MNDSAFENYIREKIVFDEWEKYMRTFAINNKVPIIRPLTENFLKQIIGIAKPVNVLEIGTAIGFSCAVMYKKMLEYTDSPKIITIEKSEDRYNMAKNVFDKLNYNVDLLKGDAGEEISKIDTKFDFIFLDGPKGQYIRYLPDILRLMHKDSILFVDNISHNGDISKDRYEINRRNRTIHTRLREFIDSILKNKNLDTSILDVEDGIAICRKKDDE